jgi:4-hydroxybenzoate polyprenyltransferase
MSTAVSSSPAALSWGDKLHAFARDIKISHTLFALPWALLATFLAADRLPHHVPYAGQIGLILLCMVTARTVAMGMNRLLDARLDALNPRTRQRALPAGRLSRRFVLGIIGLCSLGFLAGALGFRLFYANPWPIILAVPVLAFLSAYPLLKRFTRLCHYYLGMALALAPLCAWLAIRGTMNWPPIIMSAAVLTWTAGFDILYACQDYDIDRQSGLFSVPAKVGIPRALWIARLTHLFSAAMIVLLGLVSPELGWLYLLGAALAILLLIVEHLLVKPTDLSKLNLAFFTLNGIISVMLATLGIIDIFL